MNSPFSLPRAVSRGASALLLALAAAGLSGCTSVGIGIPLGPLSIDLGIGTGGVNLGVGTQVGPVGVGVNQDGRVSAGAGVSTSTPVGNGNVRVGVGGSTVVHEPKDKK